MSNVKSVHIEGWISFDISTVGVNPPHINHGVRDVLATLNLPSLGLRISYGRLVMIPNGQGDGGQTAFYHFHILGEEAISTRHLQTFVDALSQTGIVTAAQATDIEENQTIALNRPPDTHAIQHQLRKLK